MAPRSMPVPRTIDEKLDYAARHGGVATFGPVQAAELIERLAAGEAVAKRAREMAGRLRSPEPSERERGYFLAVREMLGLGVEAEA